VVPGHHRTQFGGGVESGCGSRKRSVRMSVLPLPRPATRPQRLFYITKPGVSQGAPGCSRGSRTDRGAEDADGKTGRAWRMARSQAEPGNEEARVEVGSRAKTRTRQARPRHPVAQAPGRHRTGLTEQSPTCSSPHRSIAQLRRLSIARRVVWGVYSRWGWIGAVTHEATGVPDSIGTPYTIGISALLLPDVFSCRSPSCASWWSPSCRSVSPSALPRPPSMLPGPDRGCPVRGV